MRVALILNPAAGGAGASDLLARLAEAAAGAGLDGPVLLTERPGHATELARRAARDGVAVVIAVGGDGTVNEVAAGVLGTSAALAALPAGTGNDFAREIGMPRSWRRAVAALPRARRRLIDVGLANGRLFVQSAGAGLDGYVLQLRARGRRLARPLMYPMCTIQGLLTYRPAAMTFTLDGERWTQRALTVAVANGHAYGGGVQIAPGALLDDGRFDVAVVGDLSRLDALCTFPLFYRGAQTGHPKIALRRGVRLLVEADQPLAVHADGTLQGTTPVEFTIQPGALPVLALR